MHAVLGNFMHAAQGLFLMKAEKLIQRASAFADLIGFLNCLCNVSFCENHSFAQLLAGSQLSQDSGRKSAAGSVGVRTFHVIAGKGFYFRPNAEDIDWLVEMTAGDNDGACAHLDQL